MHANVHIGRIYLSSDLIVTRCKAPTTVEYHISDNGLILFPLYYLACEEIIIFGHM